MLKFYKNSTKEKHEEEETERGYSRSREKNIST